jgi:hypothetical protein
MVYKPTTGALCRPPRVARAWTVVVAWRVTVPLPTKVAEAVAGTVLGAVPSVV